MTTDPGIYNLIIYQGTTFNPVITWKDQNSAPITLVGYTARMMVRAQISDVLPIITLTTENGGITLGGVAGTIALLISATSTAALNVGGVYDLELIDQSGTVTRLLQGTVTLSLEVTR